MSLNSFQYGKEFRVLSQTNNRLISNLSLKIKLQKNLWGRTSYTKDIVMKMEREKKKTKRKIYPVWYNYLPINHVYKLCKFYKTCLFFKFFYFVEHNLETIP